MKNIWRRALVVSLFFFVTVSCVIGQLEDAPSWYEAVVTAVVDGDTIQIQFVDDPPPDCSWNERVRFIGVDTPELYKVPADYYAREAREYTNRFYSKIVLIEFDSVSGIRDRYGRLLAYVYNDINQMPINKQLIAGGYGYYYGDFAFNPEKMVEFKNAEQDARANQRGLWGLGGE